jgi:hypothetical protein
MGRIRALAAVVGVAILGSLMFIAAPSWAAGGMKLCVPKAEGAGLVTPKHGECKKGYKLTLLGAEGAEGNAGAQGNAGAEGKQGPEGKTGPEGKLGLTGGELETLKSILPHMAYLASGIGGEPTVRFFGVNVQIVNGAGSTADVNGEGNLVIGYDENTGEHRGGPGVQTGSHNLILGEEQAFTSYGGILAGSTNTVEAPSASVTGGQFNFATGRWASVSGGEGNVASDMWASISGGKGNKASAPFAWVSGGRRNTASSFGASISGGTENKASGEGSSISGGNGNTAGGFDASVSGGSANAASGLYSSIFGGKELKASNEYEAIP